MSGHPRSAAAAAAAAGEERGPHEGRAADAALPQGVLHLTKGDNIPEFRFNFVAVDRALRQGKTEETLPLYQLTTKAFWRAVAYCV